ncbi:endonuclease III [Enhygromyxa salina]|uniref:Endonuclease III n=1 Tax=Enhygromyxa salina TaxID=215803 RepID=A0A2S9YRV5_9BACT|nr:endonuclease III [Enhygromyxa salina]PRQ07782.1 Ultraviolet N-glycosylase/AP lyase [Enhygromyxa salina]
MPAPTDPASLLAEVNDRLALALPRAVCELDHDDPWQLLIVTILSAQAQDAVINEIRPALFERWPTPAALAAAPQEEVEVVVKRSGYFRNKAKAIRECAQGIVERHAGEVPQTHEQLVALPGASHKTANLVLGIAWGIASGIVVDTHVARVSARLGIVKSGTKPDKVEATLTKLVPREQWIDISHRLILHGRHVCKSKQPDCGSCAINELCPASEREPIDSWQIRAEREGQLFAVRGDRAAIGMAPIPASGSGSGSGSGPKPKSASKPGKRGSAARATEDDNDF